MYLSLVTSYCKETGLYKFASDNTTSGVSLFHVPRIIVLEPNGPEIQYSTLKNIENTFRKNELM